MPKIPYKLQEGKASMVMIDCQNANYCPGEMIYAGQYPAPEELVPIINRLVSFFREKQMPIIWVITYVTPETHLAFSKYHSFLGPPRCYLQEGSEEAKIWKDFKPCPNDIKVIKHHMSSFWETDLDTKLRSLGVEYPCFVGNNTDECVEGTVRDACVRLYNSVVVADAVGTHRGKDAHEMALRRLRGFSRVMTSRDLMDELSSSHAVQEQH